jgi:hypothetical protein
MAGYGIDLLLQGTERLKIAPGAHKGGGKGLITLWQLLEKY